MRLRLLAAAGAVFLVILAAVGWYLIGEAKAPERSDAALARRTASAASFDRARRAAFLSARRNGRNVGRAQGRQVGQMRGTARGQGSGDDKAQAELAAIAQQQAEAAAAAEAAERAANCGAPLFVEGHCPTDEEIAQEGQAEALCGPGTAAGAQQAAEQGIQC